MLSFLLNIQATGGQPVGDAIRDFLLTLFGVLKYLL